MGWEVRGISEPFSFLCEEELQNLLSIYGRLTESDAKLKTKQWCQLHAGFPELVDLATDDRILDHVSNYLGEDLYLWDTGLYARGVGPEPSIWWHQDPTFWDVKSLPGCIVWIALTECSSRSGALRVIPGSHRNGPDSRFQAEFARRMWSFGRVWDDAEFDSVPEEVPLCRGQACLMDLWLVHGAAPKLAAPPRLSLVLKYVVPDAREMGEWRRGLLVRGRIKSGPVEPLVSASLDASFAAKVAIVEKASTDYLDFQKRRWLALKS